MKTYELAGAALPIRSHPWDTGADPNHRYYDLVASPERIRTSLEDFVPWSRYAATERFYRLLETVNGPGSILASNDCAFVPPEPNETAGVEKALECSGRVMVLFRRTARNLVDGEVDRLARAVAVRLSKADPDFEWGAVGIAIAPVRYLGLGAGTQLSISFWAWGDTEQQTMDNLFRLFENLGAALEDLAVRR